MYVFVRDISDCGMKITCMFHLNMFRVQGQHDACLHVSCMDTKAIFNFRKYPIWHPHAKPACGNCQHLVFDSQVACNDVHWRDLTSMRV